MTFEQEILFPDAASFLPWIPTYRVGIRRFDEEHERLAAMVSHLHSTMIVRRDKRLSLQVFARLIQETKRHFEAETALMQDLEYPGLEAHAREHAQLLEEAEHLSSQYNLGHISALALPAFLKKWLIAHIEGPDRAYTAFFRSHGIS